MKLLRLHINLLKKEGKTTMTRKEEIILEILSLEKEFVNLPANGGDTEGEATAIDLRKATIKEEVQSLKEKLLYRQYLELQSDEWKENIIGYEHFGQEGHDVIIKVNFTWGWLRVYRNKRNELEWY